MKTQKQFKPKKNDVRFISDHFKLAGHLHLPDDFDANKKYPALVFANPVSSVKEQVAGVYAKSMAEKGFVCLAFDPRNFGESEGEPKRYKNNFLEAEDIKNAVSYIRTLSFVDKEKVGGVGICSGGGFMGYAAISDLRIKAIALISPLTDHADMLNYDPDFSAMKENLPYLIKMANDARQHYYETGEIMETDLILEAPEEAGQFLKEAADYYRTNRAGGSTCPTYSPKGAFWSLEHTVSYSAARFADLLQFTPLLTVIGSKATTKKSSLAFHDKANSEKELIEIAGASHMALYDTPEYVNQVTEKLTSFFKSKLQLS